MVALLALAGATHLSRVAIAADPPYVVSCSPINRSAPPVVWEISAVAEHVGYCGIFNPTCLRARDPYLKSTPGAPAGADTAGPSVGEWKIGFGPLAIAGQDAGAGRGTFGPNSIAFQNSLTVSWNASFLIEDIRSNVSVRAWVRGPAGTNYQGSVLQSGSWTADRNGPGGGLFGTGISSGFASRTASSCSLVGDVPLTGATVGSNRYFSDFPNTPYTTARFTNDSGWISDANGFGVYASSGVSCILLCDPNYITGLGFLSGGITLEIPGGQPPQAVIRAAIDINTFHVEAHSESFDPDVGTGANAGIASWAWTFDNGTTILTDCPDFELTILPITGRFRYSLGLRVTDSNGQHASTTLPVDFRTGTPGALIPISFPAGSTVTLGGSAEVAAPGFVPQRFRWMRGAVQLAETTHPWFVIRNIAATDSGVYQLVGVRDQQTVLLGDLQLRVGLCTADADASGDVGVSDIFEFLVWFFNSDDRADVSGDGLVSVGDIFAFLQIYFTGC